MKPRNRRPRVPRRRAQTAHDVVRTGVGQEAAEATDLFAQRPQRISNAATQSELQKSRWRRRTGETDYNRDIETACVKFLQPGDNRRALEAELRDDVDMNTRPSSPIAFYRKRG